VLRAGYASASLYGVGKAAADYARLMVGCALKPVLKAPGFRLSALKLKYDKLLTAFAFNSNLRPCIVDDKDLATIRGDAKFTEIIGRYYVKPSELQIQMDPSQSMLGRALKMWGKK